MDPKQWRPLYKREVKAVEWLLKSQGVELLALYMDGPNTEPRRRVKHGKSPTLNLTREDVLDGAWAIKYPTEEELQAFDSAPKQLKAAAQRLVKPAGKTYSTVWNARPQAVVHVPQGTKDLADFLFAWAQHEHQALIDRIGTRARSIRRQGATYYHTGRKGYPVGHVIEPYFTTKFFGPGQRTEPMENALESARERNGARVPRLNVAYAFEDPQDAIQFAYGGNRQLYAVEPLGPVERRDMMCIDEYENVIGQAKDMDYAYEDADAEMWNALEAEQRQVLDQIVDAYWQGKPCPRISTENFSTSPDSAVWEIVCAQGFKVVAVEDPSTVDEARLRIAIRAMLLAASS